MICQKCAKAADKGKSGLEKHKCTNPLSCSCQHKQPVVAENHLK
jgi:hypothetical protein